MILLRACRQQEREGAGSAAQGSSGAVGGQPRKAAPACWQPSTAAETGAGGPQANS